MLIQHIYSPNKKKDEIKRIENLTIMNLPEYPFAPIYSLAVRRQYISI